MNSCGLPSPYLDSYNKLLEAWLFCHMNNASLFAVICLKKLLVDINLYELANVYYELSHAASVENTHSSLVALFHNSIITGR